MRADTRYQCHKRAGRVSRVQHGAGVQLWQAVDCVFAERAGMRWAGRKVYEYRIEGISCVTLATSSSPPLVQIAGCPDRLLFYAAHVQLMLAIQTQLTETQ